MITIELVRLIVSCRCGKDVLLTTPTASGKSLAFNLAVFDVFAAGSTTSNVYLTMWKPCPH